MQTTKKGDLFETRVLRIIQDMIMNGTFIVGGQLKAYPKKKYFSADRGRHIIVDIAIEVVRPGATQPNLYIFLECKDYKKSIPVDDLEEFYTKIGQLSGVNAKGLFFTTSSLQPAALNFAQSKGIGVVRVNPDNEAQWLLERKTAFTIPPTTALKTNVIQGLVNLLFVHPAALLALNDSEAFVSLDTLFRAIVVKHAGI